MPGTVYGTRVKNTTGHIPWAQRRVDLAGWGERRFNQPFTAVGHVSERKAVQERSIYQNLH